jgi:hypothetical protein
MNILMTQCLLAIEGHQNQTAWIKKEFAEEGKRLTAKGRLITVLEVRETREFNSKELDKQEGVVEQYWKINLQEAHE